MNKAKLLLLLVFFALIIFDGVLARKKFYDPKARIENANKQVSELVNNDLIKDGDIIFQTSLSAQSQAIQQATHSEYSHCGIIYKENGNYFVYEAVQPVKLTPLNKWIARGKDQHFVIKRLKNAEQVLTPEVLKKMKETGEKFKGENYDLYFEWTDERMYCSELIWKIYKEATGLEIGKLQKLKDFDLSSDVVKRKMKERYGDKIPMDEVVISPASIFNCDLLMMVTSN